MFCQFQKSANYHFFGTMRGKNVLSVPKNLQIAIFWDYASNTCPDSSKANTMGGTLSTVWNAAEKSAAFVVS